MKNEEERKYTMIRDCVGIKVEHDKAEKVVVLRFKDSATMFLDAKTAVSVGAELIEEAVPLFEDGDEFAQTLVSSCAAKRGEPPISLEALEESLMKVYEKTSPFMIAQKDGRVLLSIGDINNWTGMSTEDARMLADAIILAADKIENSKMGSEQLH